MKLSFRKYLCLRGSEMLYKHLLDHKSRFFFSLNLSKYISSVVSNVWVVSLQGKMSMISLKVPQELWKSSLEIIWKPRSPAFGPFCTVNQFGDLEQVSTSLLVLRPGCWPETSGRNFLVWLIGTHLTLKYGDTWHDIISLWISHCLWSVVLRRFAIYLTKINPIQNKAQFSISLFSMFTVSIQNSNWHEASIGTKRLRQRTEFKS